MNKKSKWVKVAGLRFWLSELKRWGLKVTLGNLLITFTKWFIGAKRVKISY